MMETPLSYYDGHGTSVPALQLRRETTQLAYLGNPSRLLDFLLIACSTTDVREGNTLTHENQQIDIYSNSWGPSDNGRTVTPNPLMITAFENDVNQGHGGLGSISLGQWQRPDDDDNSNYDGYTNSRHTISDHDIYCGVQSWYAEPGANILVASPSDGSGEGITTTDIEGGGDTITATTTVILAELLPLHLYYRSDCANATGKSKPNVPRCSTHHC